MLRVCAWRAGRISDTVLLPLCCPQHDENDFKDKACHECKARASEVEQFEQALPQKVSEASQAMKHFSSEHAACAKQYAVKFKRSMANVLLASETGRALRWLAKQCICLELHLCIGWLPLCKESHQSCVVLACSYAQCDAATCRLCLLFDCVSALSTSTSTW